MTNSHLKLITKQRNTNRYAAATEKQGGPQPRAPHPREIEKLVEAACSNRHSHRDATMILMAYRHGLRAAESSDLRWDQVDFRGAVLHARRVKNDMPSTHPIHGDELRALRRLQRESETSPFVFVPSAARLSRPPASRGCLSGQPRRQVSASRRIRICSDTVAAMPSRTRGAIPARFRDGLVISRSRRQQFIPR
jgi:integrase